MDNKSNCVWYEVCSIREFYEEGLVDEKWLRDYCWGDSSRCVRARNEEKGKYVPDNMMPDGSRDKSLDNR